MKNIAINLYSISTIVLVLGVGCASPDLAREQRSEIRAQQPADTPQAIMERAAMAFTSAPGLTAEQKTKLGAIYGQVYNEAIAIRREMGQAKSLLFTKLANVDYKSKEIVSLKNRIVKLDQRRLALMFKALDDVQAVVGQGPETEKIYKHFQDYEVPHSRYEAGTN